MIAQARYQEHQAYAARGWHVVVLTSAAASNAHGALQFTHEGANPVRGNGTRDKELSNRTSLFGSRIPGGSSYTVQGIDLPHLVKTVTRRVRRRHAEGGGSSADADAPKFAMKMDIEGGEEIVIPALVVSGALCELDVAYIEFHGFFGAVPTPTNINFQDQLPKLVGSYPHCRVRIVAMDDETYYDDEQPLPHVRTGLLRANAIQAQVYPKVVLSYYGGDDGKTASFLGWVSGGSSMLQFVLSPSLTASCDVRGRRGLLLAAAGAQALICFIWGFSPNNIGLAAAVAVITGMCGVVIPVSQAIISDVTRHDGAAAAHGFGVIAGTFGLGLCIGPLLGGWLTNVHRPAACFTAAGAALLAHCWWRWWAGTALLALLVATVWGWEETYVPDAADASRAALRRSMSSTRYHWQVVNPVAIIGTVLHKRRTRRLPSAAQAARAQTVVSGPLSAAGCTRVVNPVAIIGTARHKRRTRRLACVYFCACTAIGSFNSWYTLLDYRFGWGPVQIGAFCAAFGLGITAVQSLVIRAVVPRLMTQARAVPVGMAIQALGMGLFGIANKGWELYAITPISALSSAAATDASRLGSLQGALFSLRILSQGLAGPLYGALFNLGISDALRDALGGTRLPGLAFLAAALASLAGLAFALSVPPVAMLSEKALSGDDAALAEPLLRSGGGSGARVPLHEVGDGGEGGSEGGATEGGSEGREEGDAGGLEGEFSAETQPAVVLGTLNAV
ncbi:major facilitator superfamily domain-containing protein [Tribonema minus]|uniref:Major facilitator superfamily domain-containing protein n=1 Tax=Tribonema minus TaxID=303371 RepID=A0A835YXD6_9STRA|nr:major facilitator superfamily domain-containing protein [Tribonema minus]